MKKYLNIILLFWNSYFNLFRSPKTEWENIAINHGARDGNIFNKRYIQINITFTTILISLISILINPTIITIKYSIIYILTIIGSIYAQDYLVRLIISSKKHNQRYDISSLILYTSFLYITAEIILEIVNKHIIGQLIYITNFILYIYFIYQGLDTYLVNLNQDSKNNITIFISVIIFLIPTVIFTILKKLFFVSAILI